MNRPLLFKHTNQKGHLWALHSAVQLASLKQQFRRAEWGGDLLGGKSTPYSSVCVFSPLEKVNVYSDRFPLKTNTGQYEIMEETKIPSAELGGFRRMPKFGRPFFLQIWGEKKHLDRVSRSLPSEPKPEEKKKVSRTHGRTFAEPKGCKPPGAFPNS